MIKREKRSYSAEQRGTVLERAKEIGLRAAAEEAGIPQGTVSSWRFYEARKPTVVPKADIVEPTESVPVEESPISEVASPDAPERKSRRVAKVYTPSQRAEILEYAAKNSITEASRNFGVTRFSIYNWQHKVKLHATGKALDSPVTGSDEDSASARDQRILKEWKTHPGLGPSQVRNQLRRQGMKVSVHTVRCVLEDNGYVTPKTRRVESHDQRYEAFRPNHLWHYAAFRIMPRSLASVSG